MASTAFVLSGGASLGAVQVGMLQALGERGVRPDLIVGSSVGALNGAWLAGHPDPAQIDDLAAIWTSLRRGDIFPMQPLTGLLGIAGRRSHLVPPHGLRRLLERHLNFERIEDAPIPLHVVATEVSTGRELLLSRGDAVPAILGSAAIPGIYPPVRMGRHELIDAGVVNNAPISHAVHLGATTVYVLPTGYACDTRELPRSALGMVLHALTLLIEQQLMHDIERFETRVELHVIPPLCPLEVSPADFGRAAMLIDRSYRAANDWLDQPRELRGQHRLLAFHHHSHPGDQDSTPTG
jgi:NTE family protein